MEGERQRDRKKEKSRERKRKGEREREERERRQEKETEREREQDVDHAMQFQSPSAVTHPYLVFLQQGSPPKDSTASPNCITTWEPSVETHEPIGSISHANPSSIHINADILCPSCSALGLLKCAE